MIHGDFSALSGKHRESRRVSPQGNECIRKNRDPCGRPVQKTGAVFVDQLCSALPFPGDDRRSCGHAFHQHDPQCLVLRGEDGDMAQGKDLGDVRSPAGKMHVLLQSSLFYLLEQRLIIGSTQRVSDDHQERVFSPLLAGSNDLQGNLVGLARDQA